MQVQDCAWNDQKRGKEGNKWYIYLWQMDLKR